jgi:hypothetical protein
MSTPAPREKRSKRTPVRFDPNLPPQQSQLADGEEVLDALLLPQKHQPAAATAVSKCHPASASVPTEAMHAKAQTTGKKKSPPSSGKKPLRWVR